MVVTVFLTPETKGKTLEELNDEVDSKVQVKE